MFNQLIKERRNYEELEGDCEDRDCGTHRIVRSRWRLRLCSGNDVTQAPLESHPAGPFLWDWRETQNLYCFAVDANSAALLKFVEGTLQGIFLDAEMIG